MKADTMTDEPINPGYKRTEVGVIPEDWEVKTLEELGKWKGGGTPSMANPVYWQEGTIPWVSSGDVKHERLSSTEKSITGRAIQESSTTLLPERALLIVTRSGILRKYLPVALNTLPVAINQDIKAVIPKRGISSDYLLQALLRSGPIILAFCMKAGTTVESIEFPWLKKFQVPMPTDPEEQQTIAEVLSNVDALLDALERLIAKKRAIKQGALQALLTGRVRLPGFSGEWVNKQLSNLADIRSGGTPSTTQPKFWDGSMPWCTPTDITALQGTKYLTETRCTITVEGLENSSAEIIPARSIVMTSRATIGECAINLIPVSTNQGFKNFVPFEAVDVEFLYYLLTTKKQRFISLCGGSTFLEIGKAQLATFEVILPATTAEQRAIAEILSDMDAEIDALEKRRAKLRAMKQGMMQELLTGRIRLVQPQKQAQEAHV